MSTAAVPVALGFDPDFSMLYGEHPPRKDDGLDWIVDDRGSGAGSSGLKKFLEEQVAEKTPPSTVHVGEAEFRVYYQDARWHAVGVAAGLKHHVTGKDREEILDKLVRLGQRVEQERDIRELDAEQLRTVAWMAQSGNVSGALAKYIEFAVPNGNEIGAEKMLIDPKFAPVLEEAGFFVWSRSRHDYTLSDKEFPKFLECYAQGKPLTVALCDAAWTAYRDAAQKQQREEAVARFVKPEEPSAQEVREGLEDADDETIRRTYWATAKAVARAVR